MVADETKWVTIVPKWSQPWEFRGVDDEAGKFTRRLDLGVNRPGKFSKVAFVQCGLGMHQKDGMGGIKVVFDHGLLLTIDVVGT